MKKLLLSLTLIFALMATCLVGCATVPNSTDGGNDNLAAEKANAAAVFTLDVNPGVRIYVKADDTVITVEATNSDGEAVVAELDVSGVDYETVVERIIDKMDEKGYLEGEAGTVLISVEKKAIEISEKINAKVEEAFEKHGKRASVIEQELDKLDEETDRAIKEMAEKHNISEGKAHLIEKIREEFPELSEEDLAMLKVNDLGIMLEETSDDVKQQFNKIDKAVENDYIGREQALSNALAAVEGAELTAEDITMQSVRVTRGEGRMLYEVEFVYDGMEYEITVDAETGEILEIETEEFVEFDAKGMIDDFCEKHGIDPDSVKDQIVNGIFGGGSGDQKGDRDDEQDDYHDGEHGADHNDGLVDDKDDEEIISKPLTKGELLKGILAELEISAESLKKTDVKLYETDSGTFFALTIESDAGVYKLVVEAYSGTIIKAELNGAEFALNA